MGHTYTFPCGCSFHVIGKSHGEIPLVDFNIEDVPRSCPAVWKLLAQGRTVGIFQLEKPLGQDWSKKLKPESIDHLAALGALLRPGPLNARNDHGVSMTETYCLRKNNLEPVDFPHPALEPILNSVYGVCVFQENLMKLSSDIAGFPPNEVEALRKGVSKKDAKKLAALKQDFLDGCKKTGVVDEAIAALIWSWIEAAGRYSFCLAHAAAYAVITYYTAWAKAHVPLYFFAASLNGVRFKNSEKKEEIALLVEDAHSFDIKVRCPRLLDLTPFFYTDCKEIYFGLADIKGIGEKSVDIIKSKVAIAETQLGKKFASFDWFESFAYVLTRLSSAVVNRLIRSGACDCYGLPRTEMLAVHNAWVALTAAEQSWVHDVLDLQAASLSIFDIQQEVDGLTAEGKGLEKGSPEQKENKEKLTVFKRYLKIAQANFQIYSVDDYFTALADHYVKPNKRDEILGHLRVLRSNTRTDSPRSIVMDEEDLLGLTVSLHRLDQVDLSEANCTVGEFLAGKAGQILLGVELIDVRNTVTKKGKNPGQKMAQCVLKDRTGKLRAVCFPDAYANCGHLLTPGSFLMVHGEREKKDGSQLIINHVWLPVSSASPIIDADSETLV